MKQNIKIFFLLLAATFAAATIAPKEIKLFYFNEEISNSSWSIFLGFLIYSLLQTAWISMRMRRNKLKMKNSVVAEKPLFYAEPGIKKYFNIFLLELVATFILIFIFFQLVFQLRPDVHVFNGFWNELEVLFLVSIIGSLWYTALVYLQVPEKGSHAACHLYDWYLRADNVRLLKKKDFNLVNWSRIIKLVLFFAIGVFLLSLEHAGSKDSKIIDFMFASNWKEKGFIFLLLLLSALILTVMYDIRLKKMD